jgi:hypothetical protein
VAEAEALVVVAVVVGPRVVSLAVLGVRGVSLVVRARWVFVGKGMGYVLGWVGPTGWLRAWV